MAKRAARTTDPNSEMEEGGATGNAERSGDRSENTQLPVAVTFEALEIEVLARELGKAYKGVVEYLRKEHGMSYEEAHDNVVRPLGKLTLFNFDQDAISWLDLSKEARKDRDGAYAFWRYLKDFASREFASGHRAATAVSHRDTPYERAQFLAIRDGLINEWQPKGPSEMMLIDTMVQAYQAQLFWMEELHRRSVTAFKDNEASKWLTPRVSVSEAIDQAAAMYDRFARIYARALRSLRDLRRYASNVVIQGAGQVNIGQQQVIQQNSSQRQNTPSHSSETGSEKNNGADRDQSWDQLAHGLRHMP